MRGTARLTTDADVRGRFTVRGETPLLAIRVEISGIDLRASPTLLRAALWPVTAATHAIEPAGLFVEHIKLNRSLGARLARTALAVPGVQGLLKRGLDKDYRDTLY